MQFLCLAFYTVCIASIAPGWAQTAMDSKSTPPAVRPNKISIASMNSLYTIHTTKPTFNKISIASMLSLHTIRTTQAAIKQTEGSSDAPINVSKTQTTTMKTKQLWTTQAVNSQNSSSTSGRFNIPDILSRMGPLVPELRKALLDRLSVNDAQLPLLDSLVQSMMTSSSNALPASLPELMAGLQNSGLLSGTNLTNGISRPDNDTGPSMEPYTMSWPACNKGLMEYFNGLQTNQPWALSMLDSSGKPGRSILLGNLKFMGNYLQCNDVHHRNTSTLVTVDGKICRAMITPPFDIPGAALMAGVVSPGGVKIQWDVCLPKSCADSDLNNQIIQYGLSKSVYIYCTADLDMSNDTWAIISVIVLGVIGALLIMGTVMDLVVEIGARQSDEKPPIYNAYDNGSAYVNNGLELDEKRLNTDVDISQMKVNGSNGHEWKSTNSNGNGVHVVNKPLEEKEKESKRKDDTASLPKWQRALLAFSIPRNAAKILGVKAAPASIGCLHGIRVLSMAWVILGHTMVFTYMYENPLTVFARLSMLSTQMVINATLSVDSFFLMSGLLTCYLFLKECGKRGRVTPKQGILYYVHRYWRLTPSLLVWMMVVANILSYVGEGRPAWTDFSGAPDCRKNWWTNLLYINNVYHQDEMCIGVTWFLAHDMQFYVVAPLVMIPWVYGKKVLGFFMASVYISIHIASVIWIELDINADMLRNREKYTDQIYFKPYTRVAPFAIGLIMGWILWKTKCKLRLNKSVVVVGWLLSLGCILTLTLVTYDENKYKDPVKLAAAWSHAGRTVYETMKRPLWATALSWIIFACAHGYGGPINSILSWEGWLPMSRITYSAFLVHLTIIFFTAVTPESTFMFTVGSLVYYFLATFVLSYAVGFILTITVESPMLALEKVALS